MRLTNFQNSSWKSPFWRIKSVFFAMKFAWEHPRHAQISIEITETDFLFKANYAGLTERGFLHLLNELGKEAEKMEQTETAFKDLLS